MSLFSNTSRTDSSPKKHLEPIFAHLDRRADARYDRLRSLLDSWFSLYPCEGRNELLARMRSGEDVAFHSAFLELYTHALLLTLGHEVETHPQLSFTKKHPDFLAWSKNSSQAIIECVVVTEETDEERGAQARLNAFYESLDGIDSPDFFLHLDVDGNPGSPVPGKNWARRIQEWIASLCYDDVSAHGSADRLRFSHDGLTLTVSAIPKRLIARGRPGVRPIGAYALDASWVNSRKAIRDSIKKKALRYGEPDVSYLVVLNSMGNLSDPEEIDEALFGSTGIWPRGRRSSFQRLSGVITACGLYPWSVASTGLDLYLNPAASIPYLGPLSSLPQVRDANGAIERVDGKHPRELFGLSADWLAEPMNATDADRQGN